MRSRRRKRTAAADDLQKELETLFQSQNTSLNAATTSIPATFLRVAVERP